MVGLLIMLAWSIPQWKPFPRRSPRPACAHVGADRILAQQRDALPPRARRDHRQLPRAPQLGVALAEEPDGLPRHHRISGGSQHQARLSARPHRLGNALSRSGARPKPSPHTKRRCSSSPTPRSAHNLGNALSKLPGRLPDAIAEYQTALRIDLTTPKPTTTSARSGAATGRMAEAMVQFDAALRINPDYTQARSNLQLAKATPQAAPDSRSSATTTRSVS